MATSTQINLDAKVEVPVSALLEAAGALYALGNLFPFVAHSELPLYEHLAIKPAGDLLVAAGLARAISDGKDFAVDIDDGWDVINRGADVTLARMLRELATRSTAEAQRLLGETKAGA